MRKSSIFKIFGLIALTLSGIYGCKRFNNIDNSNGIQTPYGLFFTDTAGALYLTNDGRDYSGPLFPPDGKSSRALVTSGNNILWIKTHLYYSNNNGRNFNSSYDSLLSLPFTDCSNRGRNTNQSMLINLSSWGNRVYTISDSKDNGRNWLGVLFSDNFGNPRTWALDGSYDTDKVGKMPVRMYSYTQLANGVLCGLAFSGPADNDNAHPRNFVKRSKDPDAYEARWYEATANPASIPYIYLGNTKGTPLPPYGTVLTDTGFFYLGHMVNRLIAIDAKCHYGAWYSDDTGKNWKPYKGLPANTALLCIDAPFEEVCLVGTAGKGLWILNTHTDVWEPCNKGIGTNVTVRGIIGKKNIYKNGTERKFIYIATNDGIYESSDGGLNWTKTIAGNYVTVY